MSYLSRTKIYEKAELEKDAKKIYIFCEGEVKEINYFKYFRNISSKIDIIPIPNDKGKSDPLKLKENAELLFWGNPELSVFPKFGLSESYKDEVWFVIDTDRWNEGNKIQQLKDFCQSKNGNYDCWKLAQSNPSFEIWLYYHFLDVKPDENEVKNFSTFKEFVNNQIKGGFDNRRMPIELEFAIKNALQNFEIENNQPKLYSTEVPNLGMVILPFVKIQLSKAKEMIENKKTF